MKPPRCRRLFSISLLVLLVGAGTRVHAQVLDQVPSTALAVFKVKNLSATNAKVVKMAKAFGLDQFSPDLADPLSAMVQKMHISQGLNKSGEMAFVIFDKDTAQAKQDDSVLALVPVSDYKAFLGNLKDVKEEGGIAEGKSQEGNKDVFVAHWGDYAAMSPAKALVASKPTETMKLSGLAAKESEAKDVVLLANMQTLRAVILPKLKSERGKILDEVTKNVGKDEAAKKFIPVARAMISVYLDGVESFLSAATSGVIGLDLADDGIGTTFLAEFKPDSDWGRTAAELKGEAGGKSLLAGLPDRKYYAFAGYAADPKVMQRILSMVIDPIVKELNDAGEVGKQMADLLQSEKALYGALHRVAVGVVVADGGARTGKRLSDCRRGTWRCQGDQAGHGRDDQRCFRRQRRRAGGQSRENGPRVQARRQNDRWRHLRYLRCVDQDRSQRSESRSGPTDFSDGVWGQRLERSGRSGG